MHGQKCQKAEAPYSQSFITATVAYSVGEVWERNNRLPPLQVCQSAINLAHDVFEVLSRTLDLLSYQVSACVCLVKIKVTSTGLLTTTLATVSISGFR